MIAAARSTLNEGRSKDAAQLLTEAIYDTNDPTHIAEIRELAEEGRRSTSLLGRGPWNEVIRLADVREPEEFTGDLGHIRPDGHVVLTGRLKDVIIRKGENISAAEIENLLYAHPKVGDVAVIGLADRERGERVCAVVERVAGASPDDDLTFEEMVAYLGDHQLARFKTPEQLEVVDALPRNETLRKILKFKLREEYATKPWP